MFLYWQYHLALWRWAYCNGELQNIPRSRKMIPAKQYATKSLQKGQSIDFCCYAKLTWLLSKNCIMISIWTSDIADNNVQDSNELEKWTLYDSFKVICLNTSFTTFRNIINILNKKINSNHKDAKEKLIANMLLWLQKFSCLWVGESKKLSKTLPSAQTKWWKEIFRLGYETTG